MFRLISASSFESLRRSAFSRRCLKGVLAPTISSSCSSVIEQEPPNSSSPNRRYLSSQPTTAIDRTKIKGPHGSYYYEYEKSISEPEQFWYEVSKDLHWFQPPDKENILTPQKGEPRLQQWFYGGQINTCYNCLDRHVNEGRGSQLALIYDSPLTNTKEKFTYNELLNLVSRFASVLRNLGVDKGDRVVIYMPMIPEAIIAMLSCARIGAVHSVVFGGFASAELASRIKDCDPKVVVSANGGLEPNRTVDYKPLLDEALKIAKKEDTVKSVIVRRSAVNDGECNMGANDYCYEEMMSKTQNGVDAIPLPSNHPHYILYTSGTTGKPKGVLRDTGSHATALKYSMNAFYLTSPGDVFWAASDVGWVVGHSYIVYGPLLHGCTTVLYEGKPVGTPDAGAFWRVVEEYGVKTLFTAPTAIRAIKQADPQGQLVADYNLAGLQSLFLAGERTDPGTLKYCERVLGQYQIPVIDHWWQTELGWPAIGSCLGLGNIPPKYGACAAAVPGFKLSVHSDDGSSLANGSLGNLAIKLPLPPGSLFGLYRNNQKYITDYLEPIAGHYLTGDSAIIDEEGYVHIMARTDDIINTAGKRISTGAIEEILLSHSEVADCAVIGAKDDIKGEVPVGFVVTNDNSSLDDDALCKELIDRVRVELGAFAGFKKVAVVKKLPKTRSGKILRKTMANIANGNDWTVSGTIEDPKVFDSLAPIIKDLVLGGITK